MPLPEASWIRLTQELRHSVSATGSSASSSEASDWFLEHVLELLLECNSVEEQNAAMAGMFDAMAFAGGHLLIGWNESKVVAIIGALWRLLAVWRLPGSRDCR
jgi:hypothetical protein